MSTIHGTTYDWTVSDPNSALVTALRNQFNLDLVIAMVLVNRGITLETAEAFLNPSLSRLTPHTTLPGIADATARIQKAIDAGEQIMVHGDYDCDGVTSAALAVRALQGVGAKVSGFVPRRSDGYDLQRYGVDEAAKLGASLIITTDCGVGAVEPVAYAKALGIDVVVTDHHRPGKVLPDAVAVVNPYISESTVGFAHICGAGVIFRVLEAYMETYRPDVLPAFHKNFVDLAAIGTVADVTPLISDNRLMVAQGVALMRTNRKVGLAALYLALGLDPNTITAQTIAFNIAPALNAAGRMGDPGLAFELLSTKDANRAEELARRVRELNVLRKAQMQDIVMEASVLAISPDVAHHRVMVLAGKRWNKGLVGPVASKIVDLTQKPSIMLGYDIDQRMYTGSGRSTQTFNLLNALQGCADLLEKFGGHHHSAGLSVTEANLDAFIARIQDVAADLLPETPPRGVLNIDAEIVNAAAITETLPRTLSMLEPTGNGNPAAVFMTKSAKVVENRLGNSDTLLLSVQLPGTSQPFKALRFRAKEWHDQISTGSLIDIAYRPALNVFRGRTSVDLQLEDWRPSV